ncbi:NAD(P)-dependent oxidoreductase [Litorivita pollutaquae]|nr:NAD(P)-dependent oxidoreductase [Litorivita pollutaquae]
MTQTGQTTASARNRVMTPGLAPARLAPQDLAEGFEDLHPAFDKHEAQVAADRCYFCHDAPCMTACPTSIDVPLFIRQIATGTEASAARTILEANILGGMCARVCPTETLCEEACVRMEAEGQPVEIGRLQRFATDAVLDAPHPFTRAAPTGKSVAVIGAGPAGLAAAHRLAMHGHAVTLYDARGKAGGLNEFGIAAYKSTDDFAAREVDWLLGIGGITLKTGARLGGGLDLETLRAAHDAVFLGIGLGGVNALGIPGEELATNAVDFIADLRQSGDLSTLPIGRNVVVIGGGMTAVDAAVQAKLLGAQSVILAYRRGRDAMPASEFEQSLAAAKGVQILEYVKPTALIGNGGRLREVEFEYTAVEDGALTGTGESLILPADQVFSAIGQTLIGAPAGLSVARGKITVTGAGRTGTDGLWAGGDCASGGDDLTVTAVAEGRDAAEDIHAFLTKEA